MSYSISPFSSKDITAQILINSNNNSFLNARIVCKQSLLSTESTLATSWNQIKREKSLNFSPLFESIEQNQPTYFLRFKMICIESDPQSLLIIKKYFHYLIPKNPEQDAALNMIWTKSLHVWFYKNGYENTPNSSASCDEIRLFLKNNVFMKSIPTFVFQEKNLYAVPYEINYMINLEYLDLNDNRIKKVNELNLTKLKSLVVCFNCMTEFQNSRLTNLETLQIDNNSITKLQDLNFPKLEKLHAFENEITTVYNLNCPQLTELQLNVNKIVRFGKIHAESLVILNLSHNRLEHVGHIFAQLKNLQEITLSNNAIKKISNINHANLKFIDLGYNPLEEITKMDTPQLEKLNVYQHGKMPKVPFLKLPKGSKVIYQRNGKVVELII